MDQSQENHNWSTANEDFLRTSFPLHRACRDGDIEQLTSLLSAGDVDFYEEDDFYGWSPIHWAAYFGKLQCLMFLLERGGSSDAPTERLNQTPSHIAAYGGYCQCLKWLLQCGATLNRQLACLRRLINCLESIGVKGCDLVSTRFSQSPAHLCAFSGHPQCLYWLVQSKCDLSIQDYMGETPLHKAARTGSMECVALLVSQGAKSITNYSGHTPCEVAAEARYPEVANYLERATQLQNQAQSTSEQSSPMGTVENASCSIMNGRTSPEGQPSVHHSFISTNTYHSRPHVAINGTAHHPHIANMPISNNNQSEDCDMEMEAESQDSDQSAMANGVSPALQNGDVLLNQGVSQNLIPLAGRKRGREDVEEESYKRARQGDPLVNKTKLNGWLFNNGHMTDHMDDNMEGHMTSHIGDNRNTHMDDNMVGHMTSHRGDNKNGRMGDNMVGHMTSHMGDNKNGHMGDHMTTESESMVEHCTSVTMQEGYDSLMCNSMINEGQGS